MMSFRRGSFRLAEDLVQTIDGNVCRRAICQDSNPDPHTSENFRRGLPCRSSIDRPRAQLCENLFAEGIILILGVEMRMFNFS